MKRNEKILLIIVILMGLYFPGRIAFTKIQTHIEKISTINE